MDESLSLDPNLKEYQIQKLYIKKLDETDKFESLENDLKDYFSNFGTVIDVKTLRNCCLISQEGALCLCDLPGRGIGDRGAEHAALFPQPKRPLIRFP